jgi:hypothetical protein
VKYASQKQMLCKNQGESYGNPPKIKVVHNMLRWQNENFGLIERRHVFCRSWMALWKKWVKQLQYSTELCVLNVGDFSSISVSLELHTCGYQGPTVFYIILHPILLFIFLLWRYITTDSSGEGVL